MARRTLEGMGESTTTPAPFEWHSIHPAGADLQGVQLRAGVAGPVLASVTNFGGSWHVTVNLHGGSQRVRGSACGSRAQGVRWVGRWLRSRAPRILRELGERATHPEAPAWSRSDKHADAELRN